MSSLLNLAVPLLALLVLLTRVPAAETAQRNRDLLWATVQVCLTAERTLGLPVPCQSVDLGTPDRPGAAVLRVPGAASHYVLTPIADYAGLEAPELQGRDGIALFDAAWRARALVAAASPRPLTLSDVGVAINSPMARSQDHLHIHLDCVSGKIRSALATTTVGPDWTWLPQVLDGRRYLARRIGTAAMAGLNPFAELRTALPRPDLIRQASIAALPAGDGDLFLLVDLRPNSMAELLLDHKCAT